MNNETIYTASDALTEALLDAGVTHVFLNSGTDYPPLIESWAKFAAQGRRLPEIIISPHETAAFSAAQGFAQLTGRAQAVFVHVDVGTQNLGGTVHNAFRCRIPVFILAGLSPYTLENELPGGRNAYIQYIQNVADQGSIVREYTKLSYELRSGKNIRQMTYRAMQLATSEPKGPVYLTATREVLEEPSPEKAEDIGLWAPSAPSALDDDSVQAVLSALSTAKKPLIITSYSGRNEECVPELVQFAEHFAIPVVEPNQPPFMNFPADNPLHLGYMSNELVREADLILVIDSDMPWIPAHMRPRDDCRVFYLDVDPLKEDIPVWYIRAERFMKADSHTALRQLNAELKRNPGIPDIDVIEARREAVRAMHERQRTEWRRAATPGDVITPEYLSACVNEVVDADTVILSEAITSQDSVYRQIPRTKPGTLFLSGGSSLGWHGGAAVGMKLACPERDIVALTGDGTYIFSCPTAVHWMSARYNAPFMTVIYNNQGWNAPTQITTGEHPDGYAVKTGNFWTSLTPPAKLDAVAEAAGGAYARTVSDPNKLTDVLREGMQAVRNGRSAVISVMLKPVAGICPE